VTGRNIVANAVFWDAVPSSNYLVSLSYSMVLAVTGKIAHDCSALLSPPLHPDVIFSHIKHYGSLGYLTSRNAVQSIAHSSDFFPLDSTRCPTSCLIYMILALATVVQVHKAGPANADLADQMISSNIGVVQDFVIKCHPQGQDLVDRIESPFPITSAWHKALDKAPSTREVYLGQTPTPPQLSDMFNVMNAPFNLPVLMDSEWLNWLASEEWQ
jgi:hypothetical protein